MSKQGNHNMKMLVICMAVAILAGCATGTNLVKTGSVTIETVLPGDEYIRIHEADVYQDGNELTVTGRVKQIKYYLPEVYDAHVDVAILAPDGTLMKQGSITFHPTNRIRNRQATFSTKFPMVAERGTVLRVAYHRYAPAAPKKKFDCGRNIAVRGLGTQY